MTGTVTTANNQNTSTTTTTTTTRLFGDINGDNRVDAIDASYISSYYAYLSTGGTGLLEEYIEKYMTDNS